MPSSGRLLSSSDTLPPKQKPMLKSRRTPRARAQRLGGGGDVGLEPGPGRTRCVLGEGEVGIAPRRPRGPTVVVEGQRVDADLGEANGQLLVVAEETAHVGQDQDGVARGFGRIGTEGGETVAVGGREHQRMVVDRGAVDGLDRGLAVLAEAHGRPSPSS